MSNHALLSVHGDRTPIGAQQLIIILDHFSRIFPALYRPTPTRVVCYTLFRPCDRALIASRNPVLRLILTWA